MSDAALAAEEPHVYLAGAIEYAPDGGKAWRRSLEGFLRQELGLKVFNPCVNEIELLSAEEKANFRRWKSDAPQRFLPVVRRIIDHDLEWLITRTSFIICYWDEHVSRGAGTAGELTLAYHYEIPVYMVAAVPLQSLSSWAIGCATEVFTSFEELRDFLRERYAQPVTSVAEDPGRREPCQE